MGIIKRVLRKYFAGLFLWKYWDMALKSCYQPIVATRISITGSLRIGVVRLMRGILHLTSNLIPQILKLRSSVLDMS